MVMLRFGIWGMFEWTGDIIPFQIPLNAKLKLGNGLELRQQQQQQRRSTNKSSNENQEVIVANKSGRLRITQYGKKIKISVDNYQKRVCFFMVKLKLAEEMINSLISFAYSSLVCATS